MGKSKRSRASGVHYWRKDYFQTLKSVAAEVKTYPEWTDYVGFCTERERGLREQALAILDRFISYLEREPFAERQRFASWLLYRADNTEGRHMLIPQPLQLRIIEPTLLEWTLAEPECSEPHRWLGGHEHLKRAVELDSADEIARRKLVICILSEVAFSTHHLPDGYLGKPTDDLAALSEAKALLEGLSSEEDRRQLAADIVEERALIEGYLRKR